MPSSTPPSRGLPLGDRALAESPQSTTSTDGSHHPFDADDWSDESSTSNNSSSKSEGATSGKTKKKDQRNKKGGNTSQRNTNGDADAKMNEIMRNLVEEIDISQSSYQRLTSAFAASEKEKGTLLRTVQLLSRQQKEKRNERGRSISSSSSSSSSEMEGKGKVPTAADADDALLEELSEMSVTSSLLDDLEMGGSKADDAIKEKLARDREKVITTALQETSDANKEGKPPLSKEVEKIENVGATRELDPSSTSTRQEGKNEGGDSKATATSEKKKKHQKSLRSAKYYRALALKALQRHRLVQQDLYAAQSELERVQEVHDAATRQQQHYEDSVYEGDPYFPVGAAAAVGGGTETQSFPSTAVGVETSSSSSRRARRSSLVIIDTYSDQNGLTSPHAPASHPPQQQQQQQQQQHVSPRKVVLPSPPTVPLESPTTGESGSLHQCSPSSSATAPRSPYRGSIQNFAANHSTIVHDGAGLPLPVATTSPSSLSSPAQTRDSLNNNNNESTLNSDERPSVFDLAHEGALQQPQHDEDVESLFEGPSPTTATQTESPGSSVVPLHRYAAPVKLVDRSRANRASQNQVATAATLLSHRSNHPPQPSDLVANFSNGTSFVSPTTAGIATPPLRTSSSFAIDDGPSSESATTSMTAPNSATHYASSFSHPLSHGGAYAAPFQHNSNNNNNNNNNASSVAEDPFDSKLVHQHKCKEMEWLAMEEKLWLALECRGRQVRRLAELLSHSEKRNVELSTLMFDLCQQDRVARQLANSALLQRSNSAVYFGSSSSNVGPRVNLPLAANSTSNRSAQVSAMVSPATTGKSTHVSQPPPQPQPPQHPLLANRPTTVFGGGAAAAASRGVLPRTSSSGIPTAKFARKSSSNSSGTGRKRSGSSGSRSSSSARRSSGSLSPSHRNQKGGGSTPKFALRPKASAMVPTPVPLRTGPVRRVIRRTSDAGLVAVSSPPSSATKNAAAAAAEGDVHTTLATSTSSYALLDQSANTNNNNAFTRTASATAMPAKKLKPRLVAPPLPRVATLLSGGAKQTELSGGGYAGRGLMARVPSMKLSSSGKGTSLQRALAEAAAAAAASSPKRSALLSQTDRMPPPPPPATQQAEEEGGEAAT